LCCADPWIYWRTLSQTKKNRPRLDLGEKFIPAKFSSMVKNRLDNYGELEKKKISQVNNSMDSYGLIAP